MSLSIEQQQLVSIHRERKHDQAKKARPVDDVRADIRMQHTELAERLGLTLEALDSLLSHPNEWKLFLQLTDHKGFNQ